MNKKEFDDMKDQYISEALAVAYNALNEKGYNALAQLSDFLFTDDPAYITTLNNARSLLMAIDREELMQHILRGYFNNR